MSDKLTVYIYLNVLKLRVELVFSQIYTYNNDTLHTHTYIYIILFWKKYIHTLLRFKSKYIYKYIDLLSFGYFIRQNFCLNHY